MGKVKKNLCRESLAQVFACKAPYVCVKSE